MGGISRNQPAENTGVDLVSFFFFVGTKRHETEQVHLPIDVCFGNRVQLVCESVDKHRCSLLLFYTDSSYSHMGITSKIGFLTT